MAEKLVQLKKKGGGAGDIDDIIANRKSVAFTTQFYANWDYGTHTITLSDLQTIAPDAKYIIGINGSHITRTSSTTLFTVDNISCQPTQITVVGAGGSSGAQSYTWTVTIDYI